MRKAFILGALGLAMVVAGMLRASAASPAGIKVGYIDLQRTLLETKMGKQAKARLESDKNAKQKRVNDKKEALKKQATELDKQRVLLKPDVVAKREKELQAQYVELQQLFVQLQQDLAKREAQLTRDVFEKASSVIRDVARRGGYTMILEKNEGAVLWADTSLDITAEVNKALDARGTASRSKK